MFTVVRTTTSLSLDEHFIKHPAATFFVKVEGDGMIEYGIYDGDTLIIDRSLTPPKNSIVVAAIDGELTVRGFPTIDSEDAPQSLFDNPDPKDDKLIEVFDQINRRQGTGSINFGTGGLSPGWRSNSAFRSPRYTTEWDDIPIVKA